MFLDNPLFNLADSRLLMTAIPPDLHGQDDLPQVLFVGKEWRGGGGKGEETHTHIMHKWSKLGTYERAQLSFSRNVHVKCLMKFLFPKSAQTHTHSHTLPDVFTHSQEPE